MNYYVCVLFLSKVTEDLVVYFGLQCCSERGTVAKKVERLSMRRTATRHQHKGNGQTCSVSRKMLSLLICFAGLNATQTQPVPSFRHDWGLHNAFISASRSIITGLQLPPQRSNCRRRILEYQKQ
ncbi:unnamed protein product [Musa acuminata var. zebrina]